MYVSKEVDYALRTMIALAAQKGRALTDRDISKSFKIPYNFLALILPKLLRNGLVSLEKDEKKKEVYRLGKKPSAVSVFDVLVAVNGPLDLIALNKTGREEMGDFGPLMKMWAGLALEIETYLRGVSLESCPLAEAPK